MLELKLEKYTKIILYAVPWLVLIFIESFYFPFIITRTVFFRLLMQLGLSLYFLLLALNFKKYRPCFNWPLALAGVFFLVQFVAAIFGLDFYKSFWSSFERMEGVVSLIYLLIYLFLLQIFFKNKSDWLFYIRLILIGSVLVSLYGLVQKFNILPVFEAGINRVTATIGNAAFLAGYLLVAAGLGVYYYFNEARKNYKYLALASVGLNLIVLTLTATRGAFLGVGFGALIFLLFNIIYLPGKIRRNSIIIITILALILAVFFSFKGKLADSEVEFIRRLATISLSDGAVNNRLMVWRMALNDFKFHPLLGVGMENFDVIYNKYYTPDISENWFDRTHNVYLDQLMAGGIFGLAAYLAILFYLFYLLFKNRREDYYRFAALFSLLIAYAIHNFFVFDTLNTSFLFIFLVGLISFKEKDDEAGAEKTVQPNNKAFNKVFAGLIIVNIFVFYKLVYLPVKINHAIYNGYYYVVADTFRSYESFKEALDYKFGSVEAAVQLNKMLDVLESEGANAQVKENYYKLDKEKLKSVSDDYPLEIKTKIYLGQLILNYYKDVKELDEAEALFKESMRLSPARVEPYYLLYNLYSKKGEKEKARASLEDLVKLLPWYGGAKIMLLGDIYKDDPKRAEELYKEGISQIGFDDFSGLKKIITYLLENEKYEEVIPYYFELIDEEPARYDYRVDLAKVYYLINNIDAAVEQINIITSNSPETLKNYEEFVNMILTTYNKKNL